MRKHQRIVALGIAVSIFLCSCTSSNTIKETQTESSVAVTTESVEETVAWNPIANGDTLKTRINTPEGYSRIKVKKVVLEILFVLIR